MWYGARPEFSVGREVCVGLVMTLCQRVLSLMRTCPSFSLRGHIVSYPRHRVVYSLFRAPSTLSFPRQATSPLIHRASSTSSASPTAQPQNRLQHARTLTALHTARELITRILPPQSPELSFWDDVLREASDETCGSNLSSKEYRATIVGAF